MKKSVLGKGLSSLIPSEIQIEAGSRVDQLAIEEICLNPKQPRKKIETEKIRELASSINENGLLQPIIVTRKDGLYHLVVGERRLRAAKSLGMEVIPAIIKEYSWEEMLKVALVENLQREDLNPVEEAHAFSMLIKEHHITQEKLAQIVGKSRPYIANSIRLLNLPPQIIEDLENEVLTAGHARALLGLNGEKEILAAADKIKQNSLSVRQTEEMVRRLSKEELPAPRKKSELPLPYKRVCENLCRQFSTKVDIKQSNGKKGKIEIHFSSEEEFDRIISAIGGDEEWI